VSNQIPFIKISKNTDSKIEMVKKIVSIYCVLSDIKLSETDIIVVSYFILYGINEKTKKLIIDSKLLNSDSIKNTMSKLRKAGIIKKSEFRRKEDYLNENLNIPINKVVGLMIKIDNS
jgi:hypothetical protein